MIKRMGLRAILAGLLLFICVMVIPGAKAEVASGDLSNGRIHWVVDDDYKLTITGHGAIPKMDYNGTSDWLAYRNSIVSIEIGTGITDIGNYDFYRFSMLKSVTLPEGLTKIQSYAFNGCTKLTGIDLPGTLTSIGKAAFNGAGLQSIDIPYGVITIDDNAFATCSSLQRVTLPNSLTTIGISAFQSDRLLQTITIPESVITIKELAFSGCTAITEITISSGVASLGSQTFGGCSALETLTLPVELTVVGNGTFKDCNAITDVYYAGTSRDWSRIVFDSGNECLNMAMIHCAGDIAEGDWDSFYWILDENGHLTITGTGEMTSLYSESQETAWLAYKNQIRSAEIGSGITTVGSYAFHGCTKLESVTLANTLTLIGDHAFQDCNGLETIAIPVSVTAIGTSAFSNCSKLTEIAVPAGVTGLEQATFSGCSALQTVTLPAGLTTVGGDCFMNCIALTDVYYAGTANQRAGMTVGANNTALTGAAIHCNGEASENVVSGFFGDNIQWFLNTTTGKLIVTGTGETASMSSSDTSAWKAYSDQIKSVEIGSGITGIGAYNFSSCYQLESITLSDNLTQIGERCFGDCRKLESIVVPEGVTEIKSSTFAGCSILESVTLPESLETIGNYAFQSCPQLETIVIPDGVRFVGSGAFDQNDHTMMRKRITGLNSSAAHALGRTGYDFRVPEGKYYLYYEYSNGKLLNRYFKKADQDSVSIVIPDEITRIDSNAFYGCKDLISVTIPNHIFSIGNYTFVGCESLRSIHLPDNLLSIEPYLFSECAALEEITIPGSVSYFYQAAFSKCSNLEKVTISRDCGFTNIPARAFEYCTSLKQFDVPEQITSIEQWAFSGCTALKEITIPATVTSIGQEAFLNCSALTDIYFAGTESQWNQISVGSGNTALTTATKHFGWTGADQPVLAGFYDFMGENYELNDEGAVFFVAGDLPLNLNQDDTLYSTNRLFHCRIENMEEIQDTLTTDPVFSVAQTGGTTAVSFSTTVWQDHSGVDVYLIAMPDAGSAIFEVSCTVNGQVTTTSAAITFANLGTRPSGVVTTAVNPTVIVIGMSIGSAPDISFADGWSGGNANRAVYGDDADVMNAFDWAYNGRAKGTGTYDVRMVAMSNNICMQKTIRYIVTRDHLIIPEEDYRPFGTVSILPEDTTEIGDEAFAGTKLTEISIPAGVQSISEDAFEGTGLIAIYTNGNQATQYYAMRHRFVIVIP